MVYGVIIPFLALLAAVPFDKPLLRSLAAFLLIASYSLIQSLFGFYIDWTSGPEYVNENETPLVIN